MAKAQTNVISEFKQALLKNDKKLMRSYVTDGVELPTFNVVGFNFTSNNINVRIFHFEII